MFPLQIQHLLTCPHLRALLHPGRMSTRLRVTRMRPWNIVKFRYNKRGNSFLLQP